MRIVAIDPGHEMSAFVVFDVDTGMPVEWETLDNWKLLYRLDGFDCERIAIEKFVSYGRPVGAESFETVFWSGRFAERWRLVDDSEALRPTRLDVRMHVCHHGHAKDPHVRQALIDRYGGKDKAVGTKKEPGPLHGMKGHEWQALGVAVVAAHELTRPPDPEQLALDAA